MLFYKEISAIYNILILIVKSIVSTQLDQIFGVVSVWITMIYCGILMLWEPQIKTNII